MRQIIKNVGLKFIKLNKNIFAETPVQKWRITAYIYEKVYFLSVGKGEKKVEYKGVKLFLPPGDTAVVPSIVGGYFESLELDIFAEVAKRSKLLIDVGGNIGLYSILGLLSNSKLAVHTFEPVAQNLDFIDRNIKLNKLEKRNFILNQVAVGDKEGWLKLFISKNNSAIHSASRRHSKGSESTKIEMTSLDKYCAKKNIKPDLLKIDIEGYDGFALEGAIKTLRKNKPILFIEYDPDALSECGYDPKNMIDLLFSIYDEAYLFIEGKNRLSAITKNEMLGRDVYANANLLFSKKADHVQEILNTGKYQ